MDNTGVVMRRGGGKTSRFSRQQKLLEGLEKPKKERLIKKLSVVNKAAASSSFDDFEMGCNNNNNNNLSDGENETSSKSHCSIKNSTAKRFKLPKKLFDDCNGVDHSSVPRKLRSVMKKRNRESISPPLPDSKKLNHTIGGVESLKKDGLKKSKLNMIKKRNLEWSQKQVAGSITKDEEEVVETLYAMAGMFPDNDSAIKSNLECASSEAKPPTLPEHRESHTPAIKDSAVTKKELGSTYPLRTSEAAPSSDVETSQKETAKVTSLQEPSSEEEEKPDLHDDKLSCNPVNFQALPELCLDSGLDQSTQKETSIPRKPELAFGVTTFRNQLVEQDMVKQDMVTDSTKNGIAMWPGLSPMVLHGAGSPGPSMQSPAAKIPAWLDSALGSSKPCSIENVPSTRKVYKGDTNRRSLKRCAAHVNISRLIRDLQMPENKEKLPLKGNQLKLPDEGQRQGTLMAIDDLDRVKKVLNGVISGNNMGGTNVERNSSEARSGILQHRRLHQDQLQTATASGLHTLQKQSFNFLSLSAGGGGAEATNSYNGTRKNTLEPSSQFQVSYLHSLPQHQKSMPITMHQAHYTSSSFPDKLSTSGTSSTQQVQLQLPPYLSSSPFLGSVHTSSTILTKQQQQQLWAAQLAAQCRPTGYSSAMSQFPNWPNGRQDPTSIPCPQSIKSPSPSTLEALDPKYSPISQQQHLHQHLMANASSLQSARVKWQDHHAPLAYEEIEGGFRTGGSLQLLCNERL